MSFPLARIKTWVSETLTAADLNAEFNNIINNMDGNSINDYSATATEMRTTVDPYPAGAESLATDLVGEIARIRYMIAQVTGRTYWYQDPPMTLGAVNSLLGFTATVGSNAITFTLTDKDGNTITSANPVNIAFRSATLTSGISVIRTATAGITFVLSAGSTLGFLADQISRIYLWAIDNAGTIELAVSRDVNGFSEDVLVSTTAEGGSGAADSSVIMYSATARTSVPVKCIGYIDIQTGSTAGNWSNAPSQIQLNVPDIKNAHINNLPSTPAAIDTTVNGTSGLIYDSGELTSAVTSVIVTGLDGNTHGGYNFEVSYVYATTSSVDLRLYINTDTTAAHYNGDYLLNASNNTITDARIALVTNTSAYGAYILGSVMRRPDGYVIIDYSGYVHSAATLYRLSGMVLKNTTETNITELNFNANVASSIGINSRIRLWKRI